ncbi:MAG: tetratricopeptide repeat protein [Pseudomonadota bacterium]
MSTHPITEPNIDEINALVKLFEHERFAEMEASAGNLTTRFPNHGFSWQAMGVAILQQGRHSAALLPLQKAAKLLPNDPQTHNNLANTYIKLDQLPEAEASYRRALQLSPAFTEAHFNLGNTLVKLGRPAEAEQSYRQALALKPDFVEALNGLALVLIVQSKWMEALSVAFHAIQIRESWESKNIFVQCLREIRFTSVTETLRTAIVRALSEPWGRTTDLARVSTDVIKLNPEIRVCMTRAISAWPQRLSAQAMYGPAGISAIAKDAILRALLEATPISDIEMERFLTMVRHTMLEAATTPNSEVPSDLTFGLYSALARQCFINEYVFDWTESEATQALALRDTLVADLQRGAQISPLCLVTVSAYFPLHTLPSVDRMLNAAWPDALAAILTQQVSEPADEGALRNTIPQLTPIENEISLLVQNQYEENPYPRWIKVAPTGKSSNIDEFILKRFPLSPFQITRKGNHDDILIAGCGTGQQSIQTAQQFPDAQVLAIDLSLTSLSYAKRKTQELGLKSICYAQADIMKLADIDREFDVIESSGVLHHLADPMAGWRILSSRLRIGGLMRLGFYSEVARRDIVRAQKLIKSQKFGSSPDEIRHYRQYLMSLDKTAGFSDVLQSRDFFSVSACRDLLSHVQEHRMTLSQIGDFLGENKLQLIGFEIPPNILQAYRLRFPDDRSATNLFHWQTFENENPNIFLDMYQFWVQKTG